MATFQYTKYQFNRPPLINEKDYEVLKEHLIQNPNYNLNPPSNFFETFKLFIIFFGIGIIGIIIIILDIAEFLNVVGGIAAFVTLFQMVYFIPSLLSYVGYLMDKSHYYSNLKSNIIESNSYNDFLNTNKLYERNNR